MPVGLTNTGSLKLARITCTAPTPESRSNCPVGGWRSVRARGRSVWEGMSGSGEVDCSGSLSVYS
eukprot:7555154-Pyramimonas_sp.AAC.2